MARVQWHGTSEPPEAKMGDDWQEPGGSLWSLTTLGWVDRWGNFRSESVADHPRLPDPNGTRGDNARRCVPMHLRGQ